eukprot:15433368-Alexandrium_andersonii.AAC.1
MDWPSVPITSPGPCHEKVAARGPLPPLRRRRHTKTMSPAAGKREPLGLALRLRRTRTSLSASIIAFRAASR